MLKIRCRCGKAYTQRVTYMLELDGKDVVILADACWCGCFVPVTRGGFKYKEAIREINRGNIERLN